MTTVLPTGWVKVRLGDIAQIKTGTRNNQDKKDLGRYPFFVRSSQVERIDSYSYDCEAILVPGEGGIGSIFHYIHGKFEVHQRVYKISDFAAGISGKFIYYYMTHFFGEQAARNSVKATVDSLRLPTFKSFEIVLSAEVREQQAISRALEDADSSIASLERLITKKQAIKQGMMQELLTGRTRLPDFTDQWRSVRLRDMGSTYGGLTGKDKDDFGTGSASYVTFLEVMASARLLGQRLERVSVRPGERQNQVQRGDILFNGSSETPEEVALAAVVDYDPAPRTYLNSFCFGYRLADARVVDPLYLAYFFRSEGGRRLIASLAQGATRYNISKTKLLELSPSLPRLDEQRAIVGVLRTVEDEIELMDARLQKARDIKQGMMQELLTGRTRLPVREAVG